MATLSYKQHLAALQQPWHAKRARAGKMPRSGTPCSSTASGLTSADKENLRRQIVGLAYKRDIETTPRTANGSPPLTIKKLPLSQTQNGGHEVNNISNIDVLPPKRLERLYPPGTKNVYGNVMPHMEPEEALRNAIRRSKTTLHLGNNKSTPKIVRFRMDDVMIGKHKAPIVHITDTSEINNRTSKESRSNNNKNVTTELYEVRGNAIAVKKEGLRGLIEYKDLCTENEKRQATLQTTLKLFRRRIKLNQEKFIQPNETTTEDYVIHPKSPFRDVKSPSLTEEAPIMRPGSSTNEHVRMLRSALHDKHNGGTIAKQTDNVDNSEEAKNIKCSYRLPDNLNWGKEVSFKDIKDDTIPNVKTYVLKEGAVSHNKFRKNNLETTVTLNIHNLSVHNSITHIHGMKMKLADCEVEFDPRLFDWLEDARANMKLFKSTPFVMEEPLVDCTAPLTRRRPSLKT